VTAIRAPRVYRTKSRVGEAGRSRPGVALAAGLGLLGGACSMSFPMTSLVPEDPPATASVAVRAASPLARDMGTEDWRRAKGALSIALDPQGNGSPVAWDNPDSALRGAFKPVGQPFVKGEEICRAFLATVSGQATASSYQGTACRPSGGEWAIKDVKRTPQSA
jgi:surface antigen